MKSSKDERQADGRSLSRRRFIGSSTAVLAGLGLQGKSGLRAGQVETPDTGREPRIKEFRLLGRTGFKVSDIGLGGGETTDTALLEAVLDTGINYIDAAENYANGQVEQTIGKVLKKRDRKSVFVSTKLGLGKDVSKDSILARARKCLERLQTDSVDCLMIHCPATVAQLKTEGFHEAVRELKAEGRVRFCGLSQHGSQWQDAPETMEQVLLAAAEDGRFDVFLFVYNFIQTTMGENVLKACREKNIGTTIMKANPVGIYFEIEAEVEKTKKEGKAVPPAYTELLARVKAVADQAEGFKKEYNLTRTDEVRDAAVKFVLNHPDVNTVCCTVKTYSDLEAYAALSGKRLEKREAKKLDAYTRTFGQFYCRHACGICEASCPQSVPVNTIMRYRHYFRAQGREKYAMEKYAALAGNKADRCAGCSGHCESACPYGVPVQGFLMLADRTLTLA